MIRAAQFVGRGDHGSAAFARMEERFAIDFLRHGVMNDVAGLDAFVVCADPRIDPERRGPHDFLLLVAHGSGDIHHVKNERVAFRPRLGFPGQEALVFVDRNDAGISRIVRARRDLPPERLAISSLEVAKRFGTRV